MAEPPRKRARAGTGTERTTTDAAFTQVARLTPSHAEWPASQSALADATSFVLRCARSGERVLLVPDKEADGFCAGAIVFRTLAALGLDTGLIDVHLMSKGSNPAAEQQKQAMAACGARWVIVLDHGSRTGPAIVTGAEKGWECDDGDAVRTAVIDHHWIDEGQSGPEGALMRNACHHEPVATSALLTWVLCRPLWAEHTKKSEKDIADALDYLCLLGTMGDLSTSVKWDPPFPDLSEQIKTWTKERLGSAITLINAPRRTPDFDVVTAWRAVLESTSPLSIISPSANKYVARLYEARDAVTLETERDGRVALLRIKSGYQVHPSIATRWSGTLRSARLQVLMCANDGYGEGMTHFSCRVAQIARKRGEDPNIIEILRDYASRDASFLADLASNPGGADNFARGHKQASGGIIPHASFDKLCELMRIGLKPDPPSGAEGSASNSPKKKTASQPARTQKNNLLNYFGAAK